MESLADLIDKKQRCGAYVLAGSADAAATEALARARGAGFHRADLAAVRDREALLATLARAMAFPDWFGQNWDALDDCLTDLSWLPEEDQVLLLENPGELARVAPEVLRTLLAILGDAALYWQAERRAFLVLLRPAPGHGYGLPGLTL